MGKARTLEEKLAIAEAKAEMFKGEAEKANTVAFAVKQDFDIAHGKWEAEKLQLTSEVGGLKEALKLERAETNGLRSIVRDLELTVERHRGYADGQIDAQPPRMVPEDRERRRDTWPYPRSGIDREGMAGDHRAFGQVKPWWQK